MFQRGPQPHDHVAWPTNKAIVGKIGIATGLVTITRATISVTELSVGDVIYQGDVIEAGADGNVVIQFVDGTTFQLHANGRIELGSCRTKPEQFVSSPLVRVLRS